MLNTLHKYLFVVIGCYYDQLIKFVHSLPGETSFNLEIPWGTRNNWRTMIYYL